MGTFLAESVLMQKKTLFRQGKFKRVSKLIVVVIALVN